MSKKLIMSLVASALALSMMATDNVSPKREFRSVWTAGMGIDWPRSKTQAAAKQELIAYLDQLQKQNFNGACIHVRPRADVYFKSKLEPWSQDLTGTRGKDPGWDPLAFAVEECHKRGLEIYAWVNPFRVNANSVTYTTDFDKQWDANGWLVRYGTWTSFNPGDAGACKHCLDVIKEIYDNYQIDGMLFDDYFYPGDGLPEDETGDDWKHYKASGTKLSIADWRRQNVNSFVKELYDDIQKTRPDMRFGIGPAGVSHASAKSRGLPTPNCSASDWQYSKIYADVLAWLDEGTIDFVAPQLYWEVAHATNPYDKMTDWWSMIADHFNRHLYVSQASYRAYETWGWPEIADEVAVNRQYSRNGAFGSIYYNTINMTKEKDGNTLFGYLGENCYQSPALVPVVDWKAHVTYNAPEGLKNTNGTLSWTAVQKPNNLTIMRYTVYAVPKTVNFANALSENGDGIDGKYLLGVTYSPSYTLPTDKTKDFWYAVCVYDGYGAEHTPATLGVNTDPTPVVTLLTPVEGATLGWDPTFTWSAVEGATYTLQIGDNEDFTVMRKEYPGLTAPEVQISLSGTPDASKCYWRVISQISGRLPSISDSRSFISPTRTPAPTVTLKTPANGSEISGINVKLAWTYGAEKPENVRVEVSHSSEFASLLYSETFDNSVDNVEVSLGTLGKGLCYWRVVGVSENFADTPSASSSFTVTAITDGVEEGYETKYDPEEYGTNGSFNITSLWMRTVGLGNHQTESNGSLNRGMAVTSNGLYLSGRVSNASNSDCYLDKYDLMTGELLRRIQLGPECKMKYFPCNDVFTDNNDHVCIANMVLNITTDPIVIQHVNLEDGSLTTVAVLKGNDANTHKRVDHVNVYGDVTTGNFTVYGVVAASDVVLRWDVKDGVVGEVMSHQTFQFHPTSVATKFGTAPRIFPVSENDFYIDGSYIPVALYTWTNSGVFLKSSFANNKAANPASYDDNGAAFFHMGDNMFTAYSHQASNNGAKAKFSIAKYGTDHDMSTLNKLWTVPADGLGSVWSTTCSTPVAATIIDPGHANVYVYSGGNGLAAYQLRDKTYSSVTPLGTETVKMKINGLTVSFGTTMARIEAYTLSGALVKVAKNADSMTLPAPGTYMIHTGDFSRLVNVK